MDDIDDNVDVSNDAYISPNCPIMFQTVQLWSNMFIYGPTIQLWSKQSNQGPTVQFNNFLLQSYTQ